MTNLVVRTAHRQCRSYKTDPELLCTFRAREVVCVEHKTVIPVQLLEQVCELLRNAPPRTVDVI